MNRGVVITLYTYTLWIYSICSYSHETWWRSLLVHSPKNVQMSFNALNITIYHICISYVRYDRYLNMASMHVVLLYVLHYHVRHDRWHYTASMPAMLLYVLHISFRHYTGFPNLFSLKANTSKTLFGPSQPNNLSVWMAYKGQSSFGITAILYTYQASKTLFRPIKPTNKSICPNGLYNGQSSFGKPDYRCLDMANLTDVLLLYVLHVSFQALQMSRHSQHARCVTPMLDLSTVWGHVSDSFQLDRIITSPSGSCRLWLLWWWRELHRDGPFIITCQPRGLSLTYGCWQTKE